MEDQERFGFVVFDYGDNYQCDEMLNEILNINYPKNKFKVVFSSCHNKKSYNLFHLVNTLKNAKIKSECIITLDDEADVESEAFLKCLGATFLCKTNSGAKIDPEFFNKINNSLEKLLLAENDYIRCIDFSLANDFYLQYGSFDSLFENKLEEVKAQNMYRKI
jgi:hypothetical protein